MGGGTIRRPNSNLENTMESKKTNTDAHSQNLRKHRKMSGPGTFFVTKCLQPRKPLLTMPCMNNHKWDRDTLEDNVGGTNVGGKNNNVGGGTSRRRPISDQPKTGQSSNGINFQNSQEGSPAGTASHTETSSHISSASHTGSSYPIGAGFCIAKIIFDTLRFSVEKNRILLAAFVVMPDHWHALFGIEKMRTLPKVMRLINSWIGNKSAKILKANNTAWQDGYHDCRIRSGKQFRYGLHYIENNPVEKGLVKAINDWPWSSANPEMEIHLTRPWPWRFEKDVD